MAGLRDVAAALDTLPVVVFEMDWRGAITFVSRRWTELMELPTDIALGAGWRALFGAEELQTFDLALRDAVTHRVPLDVELRCHRGDGSGRVVRWLASPLERGPAITSLHGVLVDVTASRDAADGLGERESRLRLLEARSQVLLESLPDLVFQLDADDRFVDFHASATAKAALLFPAERYLGLRLQDVLPPEVATVTAQKIQVARESGRAQRIEYQLELGAGLLKDFEGRITSMGSGGLLMIVREVTELKKAERELIAAREQAVHASSSKSQFLANVSHEIRTPLSGIISVAQLLRTVNLPPEAAGYVGVLEAAGESLLGLVNEVLDLSKIEADRLELERQPFELGDLVRQACLPLEADARRKRLRLIVEVDSGAEGPVLGDAGRVRQIVTNLVANAVKFTDAGFVRVRVARVPSGQLSVAVEDSGRGIPEAARKNIFEPFVQASSQRGGTGLGLSISRRLSRLMGGDLRLVRSSDQGSLFEALLSLDSTPVKRRTATARANTKPLKLLVAEDNEVNARLTRAMLEWLGHQVDTVADGQAAIDACARAAYDAIFMDVQMPHLDGLDATRAIRRSERPGGRRVPIVALTANAMKSDELACLSAGMDAYLAKPVTLEGFADVLAWLGLD